MNQVIRLISTNYDHTSVNNKNYTACGKSITLVMANKPLLFFFSLIFFSCHSADTNSELKSVTVNGVSLHYRIDGTGEPLILIHGSIVDYRYWKEQVPVLSKHFQVITYSRRYNYPNENKLELNHSAIVEAGDLLGLMDALKIEKANILGHSYGGCTALWFATAHPEKVIKLILAEPPMERWLPDLPNGQGRFEKFMTNDWIPTGKAFLEKGDRAGLEVTSQWAFQTTLDSVPDIWRNYMIQNVKEWRALATSADAYPKMEYRLVQNLKMPVLLLSGAQNAGKSGDIIDIQLTRLIPNNKRVIIANAGHEVFVDNPKQTNAAILTFLEN
jgi:pimeloyl-ACP methyl ester carboxylesterase